MINSIKNIETLNEYIDYLVSVKDRFFIILTTQQEWRNSIDRDTAIKIQSLGVNTDLSELLDVGFIALIDEGRLVYENVGEKGSPLQYHNNYFDIDLDIISIPNSYILLEKNYFPIGISINGDIVSNNRQGFCIVLYDKHIGVLIDAVTFDSNSNFPQSFRAEKYYDMLLAEISELHVGFGYTIAQWLHDHDHNNITVIADPKFPKLIKEIMLPIKMNDNIRVLNYFSTSKNFNLTYQYNDYFRIERYEQFDLDKINKDDFIIYISLFNHPINNYLKKEKHAFFFSIDTLVYEAFKFISFEETVIRLASENPDISIFYFILPGIIFDKSNESEYLRRNKIKRETVIEALKRGERNTDNLPSYIKEDKLFSNEDWLELTHLITQTYINEKGHLLFKNIKGKFVNTNNGRRVTSYQPIKFDNTIYFFGLCNIFGVYNTDNQTFCSQLQKLLNTNQNGKIYRVENYGNFLYNHRVDLPRIMSSVNPKKGDILAFPKNLSEIFPTLNLHDIKLPNNYGHMFCDYQGHYSPNMHRFIAERIFEYLKEKNFFKGQSINIKHKTMQIPICGMQRNNKTDNGPPTEYGEQLEKYKSELRNISAIKIGKNGSIVMNCNPFTLGHRYLIEWAAKQVKHLYIFAVEEDLSIFPFEDRFMLIKAGTKDLKNVTVLPSGKFIISSITFSEYFQKSEIQDRTIDPSMDITLFAKEIAPVLNITVRFAGEEPIDNITKQYNDSMQRILPEYGIEFVEIKRKESGQQVISASRVRKLLEEKDFRAIKKLVPKTTLAYLKKKWS